MRCIHLQWMMKGHPHMSEIHREQKRLSRYMKNARYVWDVNSGLHDMKEGEKGVSLVSPRQEAGHCIWAMNTHPSATTVHNLKNQWVWDDYPQFHQAQFYQAFCLKDSWEITHSKRCELGSMTMQIVFVLAEACSSDEQYFLNSTISLILFMNLSLSTKLRVSQMWRVSPIRKTC